MNLRDALIWLRYFWPVAPGVVAGLFAAWLFWGLGFWLSVFLPIAVGAAVWLVLTVLDMAVGVGGS